MTTARPLMPKATAIWLIDNTILTFEQIATFVGLNHLEVQAIADGEVDSSIIGIDPVMAGQLTLAEIKRCEADSTAQLHIHEKHYEVATDKRRVPRYTPISKRKHKVDAIAWLLRHRQDVNDSQICHLIGTTRSTIKSVREGKHWNIYEIEARSPVELGLCTMEAYHALTPSSVDDSKKKKKKEVSSKR